SSSASITPNISGTGNTGFIARWTNDTGALGNSTLFQNSLGNVGLATKSPTQKFQVNSGNILVKGVNNFTASGHQAKLFLGDTNHSLTATYGSGTAIGSYLAPQAIFVHDKTGQVGIGIADSAPGATLDVGLGGAFG